jgi:hypothetical protein
LPLGGTKYFPNEITRREGGKKFGHLNPVPVCLQACGLTKNFCFAIFKREVFNNLLDLEKTE